MELTMNKNALKKSSNVIIFGITGFIGKYLYNFYKEVAFGFSRTDEDFYFDLEKMVFPTSSFLKKTQARHAIIPSAVSKINICENFKEKTYRTNVTGTIALIELLAKNNITPIWFSSDYVFDGTSGNYVESSPASPTTEYGKQKAIVEKEIPKITKGNYLIIRPGKVYSLNLEDKTIFFEIVNSLKQQKQYRAAIDQVFSLTYIEDLIIGISKLKELNAKGLFHICSSKSLNRHQVACLIAKACNLNLGFISSIKLEELNETFIRPKNTSMKSDKFLKLTDFDIRNLDCVLPLSKGNSK